jgi:hypothetical protein
VQCADILDISSLLTSTYNSYEIRVPSEEFAQHKCGEAWHNDIELALVQWLLLSALWHIILHDGITHEFPHVFKSRTFLSSRHFHVEQSAIRFRLCEATFVGVFHAVCAISFFRRDSGISSVSCEAVWPNANHDCRQACDDLFATSVCVS